MKDRYYIPFMNTKLSSMNLVVKLLLFHLFFSNEACAFSTISNYQSHVDYRLRHANLRLSTPQWKGSALYSSNLPGTEVIPESSRLVGDDSAYFSLEDQKLNEWIKFNSLGLQIEQ